MSNCKNLLYINRSGLNHWHWKNGKRKHSSGYVRTLSPDHPKADETGYVYEHRLIMEKHLGRYLTDDEIIHHKNGLKNDNRIENLEVIPNQSIHAKNHHPKMDLTNRFCSNCGQKTVINPRTGNHYWFIDPRDSQKRICNKCYLKNRRRHIL